MGRAQSCTSTRSRPRTLQRDKLCRRNPLVLMILTEGRVQTPVSLACRIIRGPRFTSGKCRSCPCRNKLMRLVSPTWPDDVNVHSLACGQTSGEDGPVVMKVLCAAYASAGEGQKIQMPFS